MEISDERKRKLWEWCGWRDYYPLGGRNGWADPDGTFSPSLPPIDLNNLFKYAVPKDEVIMISRFPTMDFWTVRLKATIQCRDKDLITALFLAIEKLMEGDEQLWEVI